MQESSTCPSQETDPAHPAPWMLCCKSLCGKTCDVHDITSASRHQQPEQHLPVSTSSCIKALVSCSFCKSHWFIQIQHSTLTAVKHHCSPVLSLQQEDLKAQKRHWSAASTKRTNREAKESSSPLCGAFLQSQEEVDTVKPFRIYLPTLIDRNLQLWLY